MAFADSVGIDAVLVEQIDGLDVEPLERCLGHLFDMLGPAIQAAVGIQLEPELRGDHYLLTKGSEAFAHELFVDKGAVDFRRIEEGHAALDGEMQKSDHLLPVFGGTIGIVHSHAAQPDRRDLQAAISKSARLHF